MKLKIAVGTLAMLACGMVQAQISSSSFNPSDGWTESSPGIFYRTEADGATSRLAFGVEAAKIDRERLLAEYYSLGSQAFTSPSRNELQQQNAMLDALAGLSDISKGTDLNHSSSGGLCSNNYGYVFDGHIDTGILGVTAVARAHSSGGMFGPFPDDPTSSTVYQSATIKSGTTTQASASATNSYITSDWSGSNPPSVANTNYFFTAGLSNCNATIFSYVSLAGGSCASPAYVSYTKNFDCSVLSD